VARLTAGRIVDFHSFSSFLNAQSYISIDVAIMPVVPPEKLVKLQQQGDGIRNVSQMINISQSLLILRS
jgi:hypothetical protein